MNNCKKQGSGVSLIIIPGNRCCDTAPVVFPFGADGHINAYNSEGVFQGQLREHSNPIVIERLWGIAFAPASSTAVDHNSLFFAAGPGKEQHSLFGLIKK